MGTTNALLECEVEYYMRGKHYMLIKNTRCIVTCNYEVSESNEKKSMANETFYTIFFYFER